MTVFSLLSKIRGGKLPGGLTHDVWASQALYTRWFLALYDRLGIGLSCRFVWGCPSNHILELYHRHVSGNHLEVGVGTGYFPDNCRFPVAHPRLFLVDLNPNSLTLSQKRLARYQPQVYRRNVLEPLNLDVPGFDSIGLSHVLHCLPGDMRTKGVVFQQLKGLLNPGGTLFGTTMLYQGVKRSPLATYLFWWTNLFGFMDNKQDSLEGLEQNLKEHFSENHTEVIGCEALFWARR